jgi:tetratricopeptide (TPR) repeat protein
MRKLLMMIPLVLGLAACQTIPEGPGAAADYLQRGRAALTAENYSDAIASFKEAVRLNPRYGEAFYGLGQAYEATGRDRLALDAYLDALSVQPTLGKAQARAGALYFERKDYAAAEAYLKRATDLLPGEKDSFYYLGEIYRMQGQCNASVKMFNKALALDPNFLDAKDGLRRVRSEVCKSGSRQQAPKQTKRYEKTSDFTGGGKALTPDEW